MLTLQEAFLLSHFRPRHVCLKASTRALCLGLGGMQRRGHQSSPCKTTVFWRRAIREIVFIRGYYFVSLGIKMPAAGTGHWQLNFWKLILRDGNSSSQLTSSQLTLSPVFSAGCLQVSDLMSVSLLCLCSLVLPSLLTPSPSLCLSACCSLFPYCSSQLAFVTQLSIHK